MIAVVIVRVIAVVIPVTVLGLKEQLGSGLKAALVLDHWIKKSL